MSSSHTYYVWHIFVSLLICFLSFGAYSTNNYIDSLLFELEKTKDSEKIVNLLLEISSKYELTDFKMSHKYVDRALTEAEHSNSNKILAKTYLYAGYTNFNLGLYEQSTKYYIKYLNIEKSNNNTIGIANAMVNIAAIKLKLKEFKAGEQYLLDALTIYNNEIKKNPKNIPYVQLVSVYNNLGIVQQNFKQYDKAIEYYNKGIAILKRTTISQDLITKLYNNLGIIYLEQKLFSDALSSFNQALNIRINLNDKQGQASTYSNLATYYFATKDTAKAIGSLYRSLYLAQEVGDISQECSTAQTLYEHYYKNHKVDSALKYLMLHNKIDSTLKKDEAAREIARIELTNEFQERELRQHEAQLKREALFSIIGIVLFFMAIIMGLLFFLSRNKLKHAILEKDNANLRSTNLALEKESLAKELEIKNKELTTNVMYRIKKNELLNEVINKLVQHSKEFSYDNQRFISNIVHDLEKNEDKNVWNEFEIRFQQVHIDFYDKLSTIFPDLSPNEKRLCAFLRLNMNTKEIAILTGKSPRAIDVARTRLRKKLDLTNSEESLSNYLSRI